jgi:hypothetical protein
MLQDFDKWEVDFIGPINPLEKRSLARYIITVIDYLISWDEAKPVRDCILDIDVHYIFENVVTRFGS